MRILAFMLLFASSLNAQQVKPGSGKAEVYLARGTVEYIKGNYINASSEFLEGLVLDPRNIQILLMLGRTYAKLGDFANAVRYVEQARQVDMMRMDIKKELAKLYYLAGDHEKARRLFGELLALNPEDFIPNYYMGLIFFSEKNYSASRDFFARSVTTLPNPEAYFYLAESYAGLKERKGAEENLKKVLELAGETELGMRARKRLDELRVKKWRAGGTAGLEYDSNVILLPEGMSLPEEYSKRDDFRGVLNAFAGISPLKTDSYEISLDYNFYQSLHFKVHDFNTQSHGIEAGFAYKDIKSELLPYIMGITTSYTYTLWRPDLESYLGVFSATPSVILIETKKLASSLTYRFSLMEFWLPPQQPEDDRDGVNHLVDLYQIFSTGSLTITGGLGFEANNAAVNYDYRGYSLSLRAGSEFFSKIEVYLFASIQYRDYFRHILSRSDTELDLGAGIGRDFGKHFSIDLSGTYINNNSIKEYRYKRTLVNLSITGRL